MGATVFRKLLFWSMVIELYFGSIAGMFRILGWCGIDFRDKQPSLIAIPVIFALVANIPMSVWWTRWSIDFLRPEGSEARERSID